MKIRNLIILVGLIYALTSCMNSSTKTVNYKKYHLEIIVAEELISQEKYDEALRQYERIFKNYDFIFLRDYKVATQLYFLTDKKEKGLDLIKKGIANGWELKDIKKQKFLKQYLTNYELKNIEEQYLELHNQFLKRVDTVVMNKVKSMFEKDQEIAYKASIIEDEKEQEEFVLKVFSKQSEIHLRKLLEIIENNEYPGEFLIGNDVWVSTLLSHHNSIAPNYVRNDTLYDIIKPKLFEALDKGYISPYEIALAEDWKKTVISEWNESPYGYLNPPNTSNILQINKTRGTIGLRTVELRNKLIDIGEKTGIIFYLPDWIDGKITIENK